MKWRNYAALLEIGASPIEVDAPPSHSLFRVFFLLYAVN